jgi:glutamyl-tRNA synthetase
MNDKRHITRIAPSPTGQLHLGTIRTAYYNWLIAQQHPDSKFIVRVDDSDLARSRNDMIVPIFDTFNHYGLTYDHSFKQSDRFKSYRDIAIQLVNFGDAIWDGTAIRLKTNINDLTWHDTLTGLKTPTQDNIDIANNQILIKSDGSPAYNFASAIDDIYTRVTWVVRGTDHIVNTFRQVIFYKILDIKLPLYTHVGLLCHMSGKKYSKRDSDLLDLTVYDPDAVLNFILRLGWSPQDDKSNNIIDRDKAIDLFLNGGKMRAPNCKVDLNKLGWYNKKYKGIKARQKNGVN